MPNSSTGGAAAAPIRVSSVAEAESERRSLLDAAGTPVITYVEDTRDGLLLADKLEVVGPAAAELILAELPGWAVSGPIELGRRLVERGAKVMRHAHLMSRDLVGDPPPAQWRQLQPPAGLRVVPCDRPAHDLLAARRAAYPPGYPRSGWPSPTATRRGGCTSGSASA